MKEETSPTFLEKHGTKIKVAAGVVVGVVVGALIVSNSNTLHKSFQQKNIMVNIGIRNANTITTELARRHNPGIVVKDIESGVVAASKNHLAAMLGVSRTTIDNMISDGRVLELGESV